MLPFLILNTNLQIGYIWVVAVEVKPVGYATCEVLNQLIDYHMYIGNIMFRLFFNYRIYI